MTPPQSPPREDNEILRRSLMHLYFSSEKHLTDEDHDAAKTLLSVSPWTTADLIIAERIRNQYWS